MGFGVDSGLTERAHCPILMVQTGREFCKLQSHDMPDRHTLVRGVRGVGETMVHGKGGNLPQEAEKTYPLPGLRSGTYLGFNDSIQTLYAWYGAVN